MEIETSREAEQPIRLAMPDVDGYMSTETTLIFLFSFVQGNDASLSRPANQPC